MANSDRIHIIGIGDDGSDGLTAVARRLIDAAELLIGDEATLERVPKARAQKLAIGTNLDEALNRITEARGQRIVVLASGDPLFYGVARFLCDKLGKDRFEVLPHVSSMQLAFARVKESWEDAYLTNLANYPLANIVEKLRVAERAGLFTTEECPPSAVAKALLDRGIDYFSAYVCENLGSPDERVTQGSLADLTGQQFSPLNVMILVRKAGAPDRPAEATGRRLFGNPDESFLQSKPKKGLLTGEEVRAIALAALDLGASSTVWDIGAGSGSVAIEAAGIARSGTTYAVEMDPEDYQLIKANAERFGATNLVAVLGRAPEAWVDLPDPDAVFVGGTGREAARIVELAFERLRRGGRLVANVASIESVAETRAALERHGVDVRVTMVNIARGTHQLERIRLDALSPTFLLAVVKP
ncbi:MAG: precorrin-6y C5,15-methyltransferase (decarboxylating) subunit CbiE [Planctomycetes bacterium]|nr:precorrin-6y C5,15-methyltransferase (decarboxylating) subunit CbiE [Planctomycetota bacterium]